MYMKLVLGRIVFSNTAKKQMHSVREVLHSIVFSKLCIRKSEIHNLFSGISNNSTASMPVISGVPDSDSDEEVLVKD